MMLESEYVTIGQKKKIGEEAAALYFWTPLSKMPGDVKGVPIFSATHLTWLAIALLGCLLAVWLFRKQNGGRRVKMLRLLAWILVLGCIFRIGFRIACGVFSPRWDLPLHLCDVMMFVEFYAVYSKKEFPRELVFALGMPGALAALITPGEIYYPFWNIYYLLFIMLHVLLFLIPVLMLADGFVPRVRRLPGCFAFLAVLAAVDAVVNRQLKSNYLFISEAAEGSILDVIQEMFGAWYLPAAVGMVLLIWGMLYGGVYLWRRWGRK